MPGCCTLYVRPAACVCAPVAPTSNRRSSHGIELAPTMEVWARREWTNKSMIHWSVRCPLAPGSSAPSACTSLRRSFPAIAADLKRRLLPAAREWCRATMAAAAREREIEHARQFHLEELARVLGPLRTSDRTHHGEGFSMRHDELPGRSETGSHRADIRVHSWHCLLQIARLVAEDSRGAGRAAPPEA